MNHIVIIGFMGSGKTRVGKSLSQELGLPFVDVDKAITTKMGLSVKEIYDRFGEPFYRALETLMIKDLSADKEKKVISLGAGLPVQEQNKNLIPGLGTVVYIKGSAATLKKRLDGNGNPLVEGEDGDEKLKRVLKQREPVYAGFADITVITGEKPFEELVKEILDKLAAMNGQVKKPAGEPEAKPSESSEKAPEKAPSKKTASKKTAKSAEAKSSAAKSSEAKSSEAKSSEAKSSEAKSSEAKSSEAKSSEAKSSEAKSSAAKSPAAKPKAAKPKTAKKKE